MLVFPNADAYDTQIETLEEQDEIHENNFLEQYPNATEEEINYYDSISGFNEYQVYIDFDNHLDFNGLIFNYIDAENEWLSHDDLPHDLDPDEIFFGLDEAELAILNQDFAYMISKGETNQIIKYFKDGVVVITDGDINTLNTLSNSETIEDSGADKMDNVVQNFWTHLINNVCIAGNREQDFRTIANNRRIKGIVKLKRRIVGVQALKVKAKAKALKKRRRGGWKKYRVSQLKAAVDGFAGKDDCWGANSTSNNYYFDKNDPNCYKEENNRKKAVFKRKIISSTQSNAPFTALYINDGNLWGWFYSHDTPRFKLDFYDGTFIPY